MLLEPGKYYHIYNRGNNREILFKEARNYPYFLNLWKRHILPIADTFAYSLLPNHFHFAIRVKTGTGRSPRDLSRCFANLFAAYAKAVNKGYDRTGSLFQKNFQRKEIDAGLHMGQLILYIHTNAEKHGLTANYCDYAHSSFTAMLSEKPTQLQRAEVLALFGGKEAFRAAHEGYTISNCPDLFEAPGDDE